MKSIPRQIKPVPKRMNDAIFNPLFFTLIEPMITIAAMTATTASIGNPTSRNQSIFPFSILSITSKNIAGGSTVPRYNKGNLFGVNNGADVRSQTKISVDIGYSDQVTVLLIMRSMKSVISNGINNETLRTSQVRIRFCLAVLPIFSVFIAGLSGYFLM